MPEDGIDWLAKEEILSFEEIVRLIGIFYNQGVRRFRLTGGEPLLRTDIVNLVAMITKDHDDIELSMTTNGIKLTELAEHLADAGLNRINISLDTLDHVQFKELTRRDAFDQVMNGIKTAVAAGFDEIKINAVSLRGINDDLPTLLKFIEFSEKFNIEVRFIEIMPFTGNGWNEKRFISSQDLRERISRIDELIPLDVASSSTSTRWGMKGHNAQLGFISSVSESFCENCDRVRITVDGNLRPCLHNKKEYNLKELLRSGVSDEVILERIQLGLNEKWKEHPDFLSLRYKNPIADREMIRIGG